LKERLEKVVEDVQNDEKSARIASKIYEISGTTIQNRIKKLINSHSIRKRILLINDKKKFLLNFIDDYFKLESLARL
jgi:SNF2 family DNA or RNA helicase